MLMTACRHRQLLPDRVGSSHHMTAMHINCGLGGARGRSQITLHGYCIVTSLKVNLWASQTSLAGQIPHQVSSARSGS